MKKVFQAGQSVVIDVDVFDDILWYGRIWTINSWVWLLGHTESYFATIWFSLFVRYSHVSQSSGTKNQEYWVQENQRLAVTPNIH